MSTPVQIRCLICEEPIDFFHDGDLESPTDAICGTILQTNPVENGGRETRWLIHICDQCIQVKARNGLITLAQREPGPVTYSTWNPMPRQQ